MSCPARPRREATVVRPRNDIRQYDDLRGEWWDPRGAFVMLHWIAAARARLVPPAVRSGSLLLDIGCGAGVLAPHVARLGHRHLGIDVVAGSIDQARAHGVEPVIGDAGRLPFTDECIDVVVAGEVLEHVLHPHLVLTECIRVLRPGGTIVLDTIAATRWGRFSAITVGERIPAGPPARLHDRRLFIDRADLIATCARLGVQLTLTGLRPSGPDYLLWLAGRRTDVRMLSTRSTSGLFQAHGTKVPQ